MGLEVGWIFAYRAGWQVSIGNIVASVVLTVVLIFVGAFLYREAITWNKILGIFVCLAGLILLKWK